jgi:AcrR family transcriptional regulator
MSSTDTRRRILDAALTSFLERGYEQTTVARIMSGGGVSNGALFHHFASKEAIADALYLDAIASFQKGLWELVRTPPDSLQRAVRATIAHQMSWIEQHPDLARFVYMRGHLDWDSEGGSAVAALNRELAGAFREWMRPFVQAGEVAPMPMLLATAIVSGPAHAIAQRWLAGQLQRPPSEYVDELARAACAGLRERATSVAAGLPEGHMTTIKGAA